MKIYDVTIPLSDDIPIYPGDPPVTIQSVLTIRDGDGANVSRISMSTHSGTHIDAPLHMTEHGVSVDHLSLGVLTGRALVAEIGGTKTIGRKELERLPIKGEERLLLKTENSLLWNQPEFVQEYVSLTDDGADYLAGIGIRLIGIDYLSIEQFNGDGTVHRKLMEHGVVILEGLNLADVPGGIYELICLPLKIKGGDGAPARAMLRQKEDGRHHGVLDVHTTRWPLA